MTRFEQIRLAVSRLSEPASQQRDYLVGLGESGVDVDELGLELNDALSAGKDMLEQGEIRREQIACVQALDQLLEKNSEAIGAEFWSFNALFHDPAWGTVRRQAADCLNLLDGRTPLSPDRESA